MFGLTKQIFFFALIAILFDSCKKYKENPFLKPGIRGEFPEKSFITEYKVDGVDCVAYVNSRLNVDIKSIEWSASYPDNGGAIALTSEFYWGNFNLTQKKTKFSLCGQLVASNSIMPYDLFRSECSEWTITKKFIKKKKMTFKIKRQFDGKTYEIQFN